MSDRDARDRLLTHLRSVVGERHPVTAPNHLRRVEEYLADSFAGLGLRVSAHSFEALGSTYRNVVASLPPTRDTRPQDDGTPLAPLLLAAHYDTVEGSPGADDNASALAVLLETAERLRQMERAQEILCLAFCLEEEGLLGSLAYAADLRAARRTIVGAIVLECVGYASEDEGSQSSPPGTPVAAPTTGNFLAIVGNSASAGLAAAATEAARLHVPVVPLVVPGQGERLPDTRRSDHAAFWQHGLPAVMLTDTANFRNPHYHRPTDTIDTLNLEFLTNVAAAVTSIATRLAGPSPRPMDGTNGPCTRMPVSGI